MSRKLPDPQVKVCWRFNRADLDFLRAQVGEGQVNALVRDLVAAYCNAERERLGAQGPGSRTVDPEGARIDNRRA